MGRFHSSSEYFRDMSKREYIRKTQEIIQKEGRDAISIRRIAREMNCSTANLYRYFNNQQELLYYAELTRHSAYIRRLNEAEKSWKNIWDFYVGIWDCYCREAFRNPQVYDMLFLQAAYRITNRNPLGSAAGYGSSFPINRQMTTDLLGFDTMNYNVVYAQMGRGKMERNVAYAIASVAGTVAKMAFDACMFNSQNFSFVKLPKECTTGSSIMPHKKNPDVFELIRAKSNKLQALPQQVMLIMNNLPCGYFRDLQIIKEVFLPAFDELTDCLQMAAYIINKMEVKEDILDNPMYDAIFSVEEVNRLAAEGMPFRDAYKKVGLDIEAGTFTPDKNIHHTHEGSIGNLCNDRISALMEKTLGEFCFERVDDAEKALLESGE